MATEKRKRRAFVATYIYDSVRKMLESGKVMVGGQLPSEHELCEELGASRMTVRNALKRLASEGYLKSIPGKGWRVVSAQPSPHFNLEHPVMVWGSQQEGAGETLVPALKKMTKLCIEYRHTLNLDELNLHMDGDECPWSGLLAYSGCLLGKELLALIEKFELPVVGVMYADQAPYDTVAPDHYNDTLRVLERLKDEGAKRIGLVNSGVLLKSGDPTFRLNQAAYESFVRQEGLECLLFDNPYNHSGDPREWERFQAWVKDERVDAVFCCSSVMTEFILAQVELQPLLSSGRLRIGAGNHNFNGKYLEMHELEGVLVARTDFKEVGRLAAERFIELLRGDESRPSLRLVPSVIEMNPGL